MGRSIQPAPTPRTARSPLAARSRHPLVRTYSLSKLCLWFILCIGCRESTPGTSPGFSNVDANYVGDAACFDCHETEYRGYQEHGMAHSVYELTAANAVEDFPSDTVYHPRSDLYYRAFTEDGRFFQEEFRFSESGEKTHSLVREIGLVIGNGAAARSYASTNEDRYYAMPLSWYAEDGRWALSPGYSGTNLRFSRPITDRCMACHNSYPDTVPFVEGMFTEMPLGIGCERCHGPGSMHVDARLAAPQPAGSVDSTIVNPAHLDLDLRLDVCQQCHLQTDVSVLREGRNAFDYRPSQPLEDFLAFYSAEGSRDEHEIDVVSHADRMRESACFMGTISWDEPMECVTCHDPHEGFRDKGPDYFNATCRTCHETLSFDAEPAQAVHEAPSNCIDCHMPKLRPVDAPHSTFTDHRIRVVASNGVGSDVSGRGVDARRVTLNAYYERDQAEIDVHRGIAYVIYGRDTDDLDAVESGLEILEENLSSESAFGDALYHLGIARILLGRSADALTPLQRAVELEPQNAERRYALAQAWEARGDLAAAEEQVRQALAIQPAVALVRVYYGRILSRQGRLEEAVNQYRQAADEEPWLEQSHNDLGAALLRLGRLSEAESALREAVRLNPDYVAALSNLGTVLARQNRYQEAETFLLRAVKAAPESPAALANLAAHRIGTGRPADAVEPLETALELEPNFLNALVLMARAHDQLANEAQAERYARRILEIDPRNPTARRLLDRD